MRSLKDAVAGKLKYVAPALTVLLTLPLVTIYQANIANWANSVGLSNLVTEGFGALQNSGWFLLSLLAVSFFLGATVALWVEILVIRPWLARRGGTASIGLSSGERWHDALETHSGSNVDGWGYSRHGKEVSITGSFASDMQDAVVSVFSNKEGTRWKEIYMTRRYFFLSLELQELANAQIFIHFIEQSKTNARRQQPNAWNDAELEHSDIMDILLESA